MGARYARSDGSPMCRFQLSSKAVASFPIDHNDQKIGLSVSVLFHVQWYSSVLGARAQRTRHPATSRLVRPIYRFARAEFRAAPIHLSIPLLLKRSLTTPLSQGLFSMYNAYTVGHSLEVRPLLVLLHAAKTSHQLL